MVQRKLTTNPLEVFSIQPSILEGVSLYSSAFMEDQGKPIEFIATQMVNPPYIEGDVIIPSRLYCRKGKWISSPAPKFEYQWMINGEEILGETDYILETIGDYSSQDITCHVTVTGSEGVLEFDTNSIIPLLEHTKDVEYITMYIFDEVTHGSMDSSSNYSAVLYGEYPIVGEMDSSSNYAAIVYGEYPVTGETDVRYINMYTVSDVVVEEL